MLIAPKDSRAFRHMAIAMKATRAPKVIRKPAHSKALRARSTIFAPSDPPAESARAISGTMAPKLKASAKPAMMRQRRTRAGCEPGALKNRPKERSIAKREAERPV